MSSVELDSTALGAIENTRAALILIEYQNEWIDPDGTLRQNLVEDEMHFAKAVETGAKVLEAARNRAWQIAHAGLDLRSDPQYLMFNRGAGVSGLRRAIPSAGTWTSWGAESPEPFAPQTGEFTAQGRSGASVLKNSTLDPYLRNNDIRTLFLMGFATHVCVESTLREAHDLGYNAVVVHDGCAAFNNGQHDHVRRHVIHHFGEQVSADALITRMERD